MTATTISVPVKNLIAGLVRLHENKTAHHFERSYRLSPVQDRLRDPLVVAHAILSLEVDNAPFTFRVAKDGRQRSGFQSPKAAWVRDVG